MLYVFFSCLFVFLGMYIGDIGDKKNMKNISINMVFGLFLLNSLISLFPFCFNFLYTNYHSSTFLYVFLGIVLGFSLMKLVSIKYDEPDNICITGFSLFNSYLLFFSKFNFLFLIINMLYYVILGIYIRKSRSWICVFIGMLVGLFLSMFNTWIFGYVFTIILGCLIYFIVSVYSIVFKSNSKYSYYGLIVGMLIAFLGCVL